MQYPERDQHTGTKQPPYPTMDFVLNKNSEMKLSTQSTTPLMRAAAQVLWLVVDGMVLQKPYMAFEDLERKLQYLLCKIYSCDLSSGGLFPLVWLFPLAAQPLFSTLAAQNNGARMLVCAMQLYCRRLFVMMQTQHLRRTYCLQPLLLSILLMQCLDSGISDAVTALIEVGTDINMVDPRKKTVLMCATQAGHMSLVKALITADAAIDAVDTQGFSALSFAYAHKNSELVQVLLAAKANVEGGCGGGRTALVSAVMRSHVSLTQTMQDASARVHARDCNQMTGTLVAPAGCGEGRQVLCGAHNRKCSSVIHVETAQQILERWCWSRGNRCWSRGTKCCDASANTGFRHASRAQVAGRRIARVRRRPATNVEVVTDGDSKDATREGAKSEDAKTEDTCGNNTANVVSIAVSAAACGIESMTTGVSVKKAADGEWVEERKKAAEGGQGCRKAGEGLRATLAPHLNCVDADGRTLLMAAARTGDACLLHFLLRAHADVNKTDNQGFTALMLAANKSFKNVTQMLQADTAQWSVIEAKLEVYAEIIRMLVAAGADLEAKGDGGCPALLLAAQVENAIGTKTLIDAKVDSNMTYRYIPLLVAARADVNKINKEGMTCLHYACKHNKGELVGTLLAVGANMEARDAHGNTPLMVAVQRGNESALEMLLAAKAKTDVVNKHDVSPLMAAVMHAHGGVTLVEQLLKSGEDVNRKNAQGETPLMVAVYHCRQAVVAQLLAAKAKVNVCDAHRTTSLQLAARSGSTRVLQLLLAAKADVKARDNQGNTALLFAARSGSVECVRTLLDAKADASVKNMARQGAMQLAVGESVRVLLQERGGKDV